MIPYSRAPYASMDVKADPDLTALLVQQFRDQPIGVAIETGTWLGLGTTRIFADAFVASGRPPRVFYTIESNYGHWRQARQNLVGYSFVTALCGCSVDPEAARRFLAEDEAVQHPERFPEVYVDEYGSLAEGYAAEFGGPMYKTELLKALLAPLWKGDRLFISLDSAGGVGWMEFGVVEELLREREYLLFLDDVEHIKHFRSYAFVKARPKQFTVLLQKNGWAVIAHKVEGRLTTECAVA